MREDEARGHAGRENMFRNREQEDQLPFPSITTLLPHSELPQLRSLSAIPILSLNTPFLPISSHQCLSLGILVSTFLSICSSNSTNFLTLSW